MPRLEDQLADMSLLDLYRLLLNLQGRIESLESRLETLIQIHEREHRSR